MRSLCAGHSSCNVIPLTSDTDPESSIFCQTYSAGHPVPNPSLSSSPTSHMYFVTHICRSLNLGFPSGPKPFSALSPVGSLSTVPLHRVPPLVHVEVHTRRGEVCYVYSLLPCYFTQSALPIYQTGGCSVYYTCDLSRVTDFARCRLFAQLGHTLELVSGDR